MARITVNPKIKSEVKATNQRLQQLASDGKSITLQKTGTAIQWKQDGGSWADLVQLSDIKGVNVSGLSDWYGMNGHFTWTNGSTQATPYLKANWAFACLKLLELNVKHYRNAYAWREDATTGAITGSDAAAFQDFIDNFATPCGVVVHPVLMATYSHPSLTTEQKAYDFGFARGVEAATALRGRVLRYELGNELETWGLKSAQGAWWQDYDTPKFTIQRGMLCGMKAGIKSIDTVAKIQSPGGTWMHTGFYDNLLIGRSPDGTTGHQIFDWDETSWHHYLDNYPPNDNFELMTDQGNFNLIGHLRDWGKPIMITECGVRADKYSNDETQIRQALVGPSMLGKYWSMKDTHGIISVMPYQLFDAAPNGVTGNEMAFGMMSADGATKKARFTDLMNFIKLHKA